MVGQREPTEKPPGFFVTWFRATFRPTAHFTTERERRSRWSPLPFAIVVVAMGTTIASFTDPLAARLLDLDDVGKLGEDALKNLILSPLSVLFRVYLWAALLHSFLWLLRARRAGFRTSVECCAWAYAPQLLQIVPLLGAIAGFGWSFVVLAIGVRHLHGASPWRAAIVSVMPTTMVVLGALGLRSGVVEAFKIPSSGMSPTLTVGDYIFVSKLAYGPKIPFTKLRPFQRMPPGYGDVIVFEFPDPNPANPRQDFVKRVVALPGDVLESVDGRPVINGWRPPECHVGSHVFDDPDGSAMGDVFVEFLGDHAYLTMYDVDREPEARLGPWVVGVDEVWVFGDRRHNSADSRMWHGGQGGGVPYGNVHGRASFIWMSFGTDGEVSWNRLGSVHGKPRLPAQLAKLAPGLARCLARRPPLERTQPPKRN